MLSVLEQNNQSGNNFGNNNQISITYNNNNGKVDEQDLQNRVAELVHNELRKESVRHFIIDMVKNIDSTTNIESRESKIAVLKNLLNEKIKCDQEEEDIYLDYINTNLVKNLTKDDLRVIGIFYKLSTSLYYTIIKADEANQGEASFDALIQQCLRKLDLAILDINANDKQIGECMIKIFKKPIAKDIFIFEQGYILSDRDNKLRAESLISNSLNAASDSFYTNFIQYTKKINFDLPYIQKQGYILLYNFISFLLVNYNTPASLSSFKGTTLICPGFTCYGEILGKCCLDLVK